MKDFTHTHEISGRRNEHRGTCRWTILSKSRQSHSFTCRFVLVSLQGNPKRGIWEDTCVDGHRFIHVHIMSSTSGLVSYFTISVPFNSIRFDILMIRTQKRSMMHNILPSRKFATIQPQTHSTHRRCTLGRPCVPLVAYPPTWPGRPS
jgi:hypothetical protein